MQDDGGGGGRKGACCAGPAFDEVRYNINPNCYTLKISI